MSIRIALAALLVLASCKDSAKQTATVGSDSTPPPIPVAAIPQLPIDSFAVVPPLVRAALGAQRCSVPQAYYTLAHNNVISGDFGGKGQEDWAALCVRGDSAVVVVVWGGPVHCASVLAAAPLQNYLRSAADNVAFARAIEPAAPNLVHDAWNAYGGPVPATDHKGISDALLGRGSVIHYCNAGEWLAFPGN